MTADRVNPTYYAGDLRGDLIAEALAAVLETGPASVSLRALGRRLGVSHAAHANHFPTKQALFSEIARQGFVALSRALAEAGSREPDPRLRIRRLGFAYLEFATTHPAHFSVMFRRDLYDAAHMQSEADATFGILVDACRAAQSSGWRPGTNTHGLATVLWSLVHGYAHLEAEGANLRVDRRELIESFDPEFADEHGD